MTTTALPVRWHRMAPFVLIGGSCVVAGGLVAAVTGPTGFQDGSWVAAYLVLVAGVAQVGLGAGQALLPATAPTRRTTTWQLLAWNGGNAIVLAGTLAGIPAVVAVGGVALVLALVMFLRAVTRPRAGVTGPLRAYWLLAGLLTVSIPVGLVLSAIRHG